MPFGASASMVLAVIFPVAVVGVEVAGGGGSQKMGAKCLAQVTHSKKGAAGVSGPVRGRDPEVPEGGNPRPSSTPRTSISPTVSLGKRNGDTEEGLPPAHRVAGAGDPHVFGSFLSVYILSVYQLSIIYVVIACFFFFLSRHRRIHTILYFAYLLKFLLQKWHRDKPVSGNPANV